MSGETDLSTPDSPGLIYEVDTLDGPAITRAERFVDVSDDWLTRHGSPHDVHTVALGIDGHGLGVVWYRRLRTVAHYRATGRTVYRYERMTDV